MKLNLFLLASIFAALHLCKAGPLRLQKRAAFYIANETACVVDNIVYSNGDPIPTDDPCEACKCRPPGFACVLKECKVKPGCRAIRHAGHCCPEYICGCEHNGRMYRDGEEIRDDKNPCYTCHCQGSSIACAFVDCFFRVDCIPVYMPGECCPQYTNCTRDAPESNPLNENNALPSLSLLPVLNDESILPINLPTAPQEPESSEILTDPPTQPSTDADRSEETVAPVTTAIDESNELQTTTSESSASEEIKLDPVVEENSPDDETASTESNNAELSKDESENKAVDESENKAVDESGDKVLFHSDTEIKTDENSETITEKNEDPTEPSEEIVKVDPQTTVANDEEPVNEAEVTEKPSETGSTITEIPTTEETTEKHVKNSAADNSKSLKLTDNETGTEEESNESEKEEEVKTEEPDRAESKSDETVTQSPTESLSETESADTSEGNPQPEENIAEESQNNPQAAFYSNDDKIKSESAETVTIVVHVKEKAKPTTETDFVSEQITPESVTSATQENLLKSNDELLSTEVHTDPAEVEKVASTSTNFEVFPSSTEISRDQSTSSPPTDEKLNEAESRSDETESSTSDTEENPTSNENTSDLERKEESSVATTTQNMNDATESTPAEARANEETTDEPKTDEPRVTVIKIEEPNVEIKIKITTSSETDISKTENESENEGTTEATKSAESVEENKPEVREDDSKPEEKGETTSTENVKETTPVEKVESTSPPTEGIKPEERSAEAESGEKTDAENIENAKPEEPLESKPEVTTEPRDQSTEGSTEPDTPNKDNE